MPSTKSSDASPQDAIRLLTADHKAVKALFEAFEKIKGRENADDEKADLVQRICTELTTHTIIEEEIFYPACKGKVEDDTMNEAYVEHDGAKILIAEIEDSGPEAAFYDAKIRVLSEDIKHHVKEEEQRSDGMFVQAKDAGLDVEALGARLAARKKELLAQFKANGLPSPETRSFTGHKVIQKSPVATSATA